MGVLMTVILTGVPSQATTLVTVPAISGHAWQPGSATCFSNGSFSNGIQNACSNGQSWLTPLPVAVTAASPGGNFNVNMSYTAGVAPGSSNYPLCRAVVRSGTDTSVYLSGAVSVSNSFTSIGSATVNVLSDTQHLDCFFNASPTAELTYFQGSY